MKLTDQEQVILKAIGYGVAQISQVIRAVGYPKATVKKILARLSEKGIVALHRHDYPQSLTPAQRKLMLRLKDKQGRWSYYNAVSMRKRNPSKREEAKQRAYDKKLAEYARGLQAKGLTSTQIADRVFQRFGQIVHRVNQNEIVMRGRGQSDYIVKLRNPKGKHLRGATAKQDRQYEHILESAKKYRRYGKRKKEVAARTVRGKQNPKEKKAGKGKTALKKTGKALKGFAKGALGAASQIFGAGAEALNPVRRKRVKKKASKRNVSRIVRPIRSKARRPTTASKAKHQAKRSRSRKNVASKRKASTTAKARSMAKARKVAARRVAGRALKKSSGLLKKRGCKNPSAESIRKTFAGSVSGSRDLFFPQGTPQGLAKLGKLVSITTEEGTIKPVSGTAWLCADTKGKLHIGSTGNAPLFDGPARSFGKVSKVEYEGAKPHLGYKGPIIWFHHLGEESGHKPTLHADGKGGLVFRGGHYRLTKRGIEN